MRSAQRLVGLEVPVRAEPAGVHHPLRDPLVVEVEDLLPEVEVLEQRRPTLADPQRVLVVGDRNALLRRQARSPPGGDLVGLAARTGPSINAAASTSVPAASSAGADLLASSPRCAGVDERP